MQAIIVQGSTSLSRPKLLGFPSSDKMTITMGAEFEPAFVGSQLLNGDSVHLEHSAPSEKRPRLKLQDAPYKNAKTDPWKPPPSAWTPLCHPRADDVARTVDNYFLEHWPFLTHKYEEKFLRAGFSRVTCLYFPTAKDDRIEYACRLLTILFLIDGER